MRYFLHISCIPFPPFRYSSTALCFSSAEYTRFLPGKKASAPSASYRYTHTFRLSLSTPHSRAASAIPASPRMHFLTILTFSSALIFPFCGMTMLPLCLTVFFFFTVSHRGSISDGGRAALLRIFTTSSWPDRRFAARGRPFLPAPFQRSPGRRGSAGAESPSGTSRRKMQSVPVTSYRPSDST